MGERIDRPAAREPSSSAELGIALALVLVETVLLMAYRYRLGVSDFDAMNMAAGMAYGLHPGVPIADTMVYGRLVSPGIYFVVRAVHALAGLGPAGVLAFLNGLAIASGALLPAATYALFRRALARAPATAATLIAMTSPILWEAGCSFHPAGPSALLLFAGILVFGGTTGARNGPVRTALAGVLGFAALAMRAEVALVFPSLALAAWLRDRQARASGEPARVFAPALVALGGATLAFLALARSLAPPAAAGHAGGLVGFVHDFVALYLDARAAARTLVWAVLGMGAATCVFAAASFWPGARAGAPDGRAWRAVALVWLLPSLLFWLPNRALVLRHFMLVVPALAFLVVTRWPARASVALKTAFVGLLILVNLGAPEALYGVWNARHSDDPKHANGAFFAWHREQETVMQRYARLGVAAKALARRPSPAPVFAQTDWGSAGHLVLALATAGVPVRRVSVESPAPLVTVQRYVAGEHRLELLTLPVEWSRTPGAPTPEVRALLVRGVEEAVRAGGTGFVSREYLQAGLIPDSLRSDVTEY